MAIFCFCLAFLGGGYCLGRLSNPHRMWFEFEFDPDPLTVEDNVVPLDAARVRLRDRRAS
ncbi:MAG: hypothetical protein ABR529_10600 [Actinomycetota bacterium]